MTLSKCISLALCASLSALPGAHAAGVLLAFSAGEYDGWETWPWENITHLAFWTAPNATVRAQAEAHGVRLYQDAHIPDKSTWTNETARAAFAQEKADQVKSVGLHGVLFDYEGNGLSSDENKGYTALTQAVSDALRPLNASVFVCVGGRPSYEVRNYDYTGLAAAAEFLFIMAYDMHFWDDYTCVVKGTCSPAEAPIRDVNLGITEYLKQVPANKLVVGLPWYGQRYDNIVVPWNMGQIPYSAIPQILDGSLGRHVDKKTFDQDSSTWKIDCTEDCWGGSKEHRGKVIWYDDASTLKPKYALAKKYGLRGVGMWEASNLPTDPKYVAEATAMWDAIVSWDSE